LVCVTSEYASKLANRGQREAKLRHQRFSQNNFNLDVMELHINRTIGPILSFRVDVTYSRGSTFNYKKSHYSHAEYDHVSVLISIKIYRLNYILHFIIVCTYKIYLNEEKFALASLHY